MFHNIFTGCTIIVNPGINGCLGQHLPVALDTLKLLRLKFIAVHVTGGEIYIVLHFELTLDFRFYS